MIIRCKVLSLVYGALALSAAAVSRADSKEEPAAQSEEKAVTQDEILTALAGLGAEEKAALAKDPALLKHVAGLMVAQRLLLKEARGTAWDQRPEVQAKMQRAQDTVLAESWLQSVTEPPADYPDEATVKAAYEAQKDSLARPKQYRLAQIFIACPKTAAKADVKKAEVKLAGVKKKLAAYEQDFASIAREHSDEAGASEKGGEIGWLSDGQIQPELRPLITRLLKHEISVPVRLNDGWHIIKCLDVRAAGTPALDEMRHQLVTQLRAQKTKTTSEAHVAALLKENPLTLDEAALAAALAGGGKAPAAPSNFKTEDTGVAEATAGP